MTGELVHISQHEGAGAVDDEARAGEHCHQFAVALGDFDPNAPRKARCNVGNQISGVLRVGCDHGGDHQAAALRDSLFGTRPVWIAASTHEGEEALVLQAFARLRAEHPRLLLALAPRHPPRFELVAQLCQAEGFSLARRSLGESAANAEVFLLDTLGELRLFYAAADIAFVGGSLVPVGGHNVLEPALVGLPVVFGPHMFNFEEAGRRLLEADGAARVKDAEELGLRVGEWLQDAEVRRRMGGNGRRFVEAGRGALGRVEAALAGLLAQG